jgi:L-iditol 2-dehydrogenase
MKALAVVEAGRMELVSIARPVPRPHEVLVRIAAVGLCGTDYHIFEGRANYHSDASGRLIPLKEHPQILGHEMCGTVVEAGSEVSDLLVGDRVTIDQGLNCRSRLAGELCEYCVTGNTHQCINYAEHGITGLQGGLAEFIAIPAVNAVKIDGDTPFEEVALVEPLGCIVHTSEVAAATPARYTIGGERPVNSILVCGAGPAGLLFTQYLRNVVGYDGLLVVAEPNPSRRRLAEQCGAVTLDPEKTDLVEAIGDLTRGQRIQYLIEAAGIGQIFALMPAILRKQATVVLYAHGHHGVDLGVLNNVQFLEPALVATVGASGSLDADGRPRTYRKALELITSGRIDVGSIVTHRYRSLDSVPDAFTRDRFGTDFIKGVAALA